MLSPSLDSPVPPLTHFLSLGRIDDFFRQSLPVMNVVVFLSFFLTTMTHASALKEVHYQYQYQLSPQGYQGQVQIDFDYQALPSVDQEAALSLTLGNATTSALKLNQRYFYPRHVDPDDVYSQTHGQSQIYSDKAFVDGNNQLNFSLSKNLPLETSRWQRFQAHHRQNANDHLALLYFPNFTVNAAQTSYSVSLNYPANWELLNSHSTSPCPKQITIPKGYQCASWSALTPEQWQQWQVFIGEFDFWQHPQQPQLQLWAIPNTLDAKQAWQWLAQMARAQQSLAQHLPQIRPSPYLLLSAQDTHLPMITTTSLATLLSLPKDRQTQYEVLLRNLLGEDRSQAPIRQASLQWLSQTLAQREMIQTLVLSHSEHSSLWEDESYITSESENESKVEQAELPPVTIEDPELIMQFEPKPAYAERLKIAQQQRGEAALIHALAQALTQPPPLAQAIPELAAQDVNILSSERRCENGVLQQLNLYQKPNRQGQYHQSKIDIALYYKQGAQIKLDRMLSVELQGAFTAVPQAQYAVCPDLIWAQLAKEPNLRQQIDRASLQKLKRQLGQFETTAMTTDFWRQLWQGVQQGLLDSQSYLGLLLINAPEMNNPALSTLLSEQVLALSEYYRSHATRSYQQAALNALEQFSLQRAIESQQRIVQQNWLNAYLQLAHTPEALTHLAELLLKRARKGLPPLKPAQRFLALQQLHRYQYAALAEVQANMHPKLRLSKAQQSALEVIGANAELKYQWLQKLPQLPYATQNLVMANLYPSEQANLNEQTVSLRLAELKTMTQEPATVYQTSYARYLTPRLCRNDVLSQLNALLMQPLAVQIKAEIEQHQQWLQQCLKINAL